MATQFPSQRQETQPGKQHVMEPAPRSERPRYRPSGKLENKVALITGGDSGIGLSVANLFCLEGATVAITYVPGQEDKDSEDALALLGNTTLIDYTATKGAIVAFTRALALHLVKRGIRVNGVAPGPVWTPLIPASAQQPEQTEHFGEQCPMGRAAQPDEIAPSYVFLASDDAVFFTGQVLHPNGGMVVNA